MSLIYPLPDHNNAPSLFLVAFDKSSRILFIQFDSWSLSLSTHPHVVIPFFLSAPVTGQAQGAIMT